LAAALSIAKVMLNPSLTGGFMITLFKFGFLFCVIIQLAMIDQTLQQSLETIRLYNESKYPLTGTQAKTDEPNPLTNPEPVNGDNKDVPQLKPSEPLHNGEVKK